MPGSQEETHPRLRQPWARTLLLHTLLAGLCPLVPIPYVDDAVLGHVRRRMVREILSESGLKPSRSYVELLTRTKLEGCVTGCLYGVLVYPVKKIFRKIFILLTIKECVDEASAAFHLGYLVHLAAERGSIDERAVADDGTALRAVRAAIDRTCLETDTRPITKILGRAFTGSKALMRAASAKLRRSIRGKGVTPDAEDLALRDVLQTLEREIWLEQGYLEGLERTFDASLGSSAT